MRTHFVNALIEGNISPRRASSVRAPITSAESTSVSPRQPQGRPSASIPCVPLISETASLALEHERLYLGAA